MGPAVKAASEGARVGNLRVLSLACPCEAAVGEAPHPEPHQPCQVGQAPATPPPRRQGHGACARAPQGGHRGPAASLGRPAWGWRHLAQGSQTQRQGGDLGTDGRTDGRSNWTEGESEAKGRILRVGGPERGLRGARWSRGCDSAGEAVAGAATGRGGLAGAATGRARAEEARQPGLTRLPTRDPGGHRWRSGRASRCRGPTPPWWALVGGRLSGCG